MSIASISASLMMFLERPEVGQRGLDPDFPLRSTDLGIFRLAFCLAEIGEEDGTEGPVVTDGLGMIGRAGTLPHGLCATAPRMLAMPVVRSRAHEAVAPSATIKFGFTRASSLYRRSSSGLNSARMYLPGMSAGMSAMPWLARPATVLNVVRGFGLEVEDVRDEAVVATDADLGEQAVEDAAGVADEGLAGGRFLFTPGFADEGHFHSLACFRARMAAVNMAL